MTKQKWEVLLEGEHGPRIIEADIFSENRILSRRNHGDYFVHQEESANGFRFSNLKESFEEIPEEEDQGLSWFEKKPIFKGYKSQKFIKKVDFELVAFFPKVLSVTKIP